MGVKCNCFEIGGFPPIQTKGNIVAVWGMTIFQKIIFSLSSQLCPLPLSETALLLLLLPPRLNICLHYCFFFFQSGTVTDGCKLLSLPRPTCYYYYYLSQMNNHLFIFKAFRVCRSLEREKKRREGESVLICILISPASACHQSQPAAYI